MLKLLFVVLLAFSNAQATMNEIIVTGTTGDAYFGDNYSGYGLSSEYLRNLNENIQLAGLLGYNFLRTSSSSSSDTSIIGLGPTFNFGDNMSDSLFVDLRYALKFSKSKRPGNNSNDDESAVYLRFGKRWMLSENFVYRPFIQYYKKTSDSDGRIENGEIMINFLSASFLF